MSVDITTVTLSIDAAKTLLQELTSVIAQAKGRDIVLRTVNDYAVEVEVKQWQPTEREISDINIRQLQNGKGVNNL